MQEFARERRWFPADAGRGLLLRVLRRLVGVQPPRRYPEVQRRVRIRDVAGDQQVLGRRGSAPRDRGRRPHRPPLALAPGGFRGWTPPPPAGFPPPDGPRAV